jgi:hypothetical protein
MIPEAVADEVQEAVATSPPGAVGDVPKAKLDAVEVRARERVRK